MARPPMTEHDRTVASIEWAQAQPCAWCGNEKRLEGDHLGARCREKWDARARVDEQLDTTEVAR